MLFILGACLAAACVATRAAGWPAGDAATATPTATATLTPTRTSTSTPTPTATATPTPTATLEPVDLPAPLPPPAEPPVSEVLSAEQPPADAPSGGTYLPLPDGVAVIWGGCASDGRCESYNFYWAPTHEVVMQNGEGQHKVQHELCHAHQHWSINGGAPLAPSDYDLESWYGTAEAQSFANAVSGEAWPWSHSAVNGIEDFAWTCGYWYYDPGYLQAVSPIRYRWAQQNLP